MNGTVLVTGATGFIGSRLCPALEQAGWTVRAMTRHPEDYAGAGEPVAGDVSDPDSLVEALRGVRAAYYLVHSLSSSDFVEKDAAAARAFGRAAAEAGVEQIVYMGGLGSDDDDLSDHLRSRREVEGLLAEGGVPVTVLRAAIVVGHGGISWEITRQLVKHLPVMIAPIWVTTRSQPIALPDVIRYLVGVLGHPDAVGRVFEIGGPEVLSYSDMLRRAGKVQNGRDVPILTVPLFTPNLSSHWLALITDVDVATGRNLIDSMSNEVVVHDDSIRAVVPGQPIGYDEAVRLALAERAAAGADDGRPGDRGRARSPQQTGAPGTRAE
jgi:uncharacterized protein YbjT (DUF2867 family)